MKLNRFMLSTSAYFAIGLGKVSRGLNAVLTQAKQLSLRLGISVILFTLSAQPVSFADDSTSERLTTQRFVGIEDQVLDQLTGRIWQRCSLGQRWDTKLGCVGVAKKIWFDEAKRLQNKTWRLPNIEEIKSLFNDDLQTVVDKEVFPDTPATWYWATESNGIPAVWGVSCEEYEDSCFRGNGHAVRLIQRTLSTVKLKR